MKLLFLILAHDQPENTLELARRLTAAATDATALIHYDARSPGREFAVLEQAAARDPRLRLVRKRVKGAWGSFGLVEAPLNALAQAEAEGLDPDYVVLLSGSCLPCRPVAQLERYLAENAGCEFIEVGDESWIGNGWRSERWRYRFWFNHKTQHAAEWAFFQAQRALGLARRFPEGLTPRFGSQWWALTWETCRRILADTRSNPRRLDFFRSVWIPDEMMFQTYVHALVEPSRIAGYGLTHFQFTNRGKPVVFHDDHADYVGTLPRFFFRKAAPGAAGLRQKCLARAGEPDDGAPLGRIGRRCDDYRLKMAAQTHFPAPGHVFYRSQFADAPSSVLATRSSPYVVLLGPPSMTRELAAGIAGAPGMTVLGEIFAPGEVDLGPERERFGGLRRDDAGLRDAHPALYLMRLRERAEECPVLTWSPFHAPKLLEAVLRDRAALIVACLPFTGDWPHDRRLLALSCRPGQADPTMAPALRPGSPLDEVYKARFDTMAEAPVQRLIGARKWRAVQEESVETDRDRIIAMPWAAGRSEIGPGQRRALFEGSLDACRFRARPWFAALRAALEGSYPGALERVAGGLGPAGLPVSPLRPPAEEVPSRQSLAEELAS